VAERGPGRDELWRAVERELRRFAEAYERLPEWLWSPETVKMMRAIRPKLERLGELELKMSGSSKEREAGTRTYQRGVL